MSSIEDFMTGGSDSIKLQPRPVEKKINKRNCKHTHTILQSAYSMSKGNFDVNVCVDCGHNLE